VSGSDTQVVLKTLFLSSPTLSHPIVIDLTQGPEALANLKKNPGERVSLSSSGVRSDRSDHQGGYRVLCRNNLRVRCLDGAVSTGGKELGLTAQRRGRDRLWLEVHPGGQAIRHQR